ncbi:MAG: hypothetical protein CO065_17145 [Comamonadaceae bacterium CG_4_9_14_0_8_um_filter_57_21]|nr:MAG: hypothetical protein AUK50_02625 [Comamonadaceae bacterium CG2_30_57_122]PIZ22363.1 MAG: hypothetical protein COY49_08935 [Comamonadaceae bacterium CG_4_10_14_0_8_um_filter_57_29]PJC13020.1 MAG: hypothetical protein CO065_17145 [Comamonadaceae bacterium CG_4_9_14_0_8_um_filter_57_21]
MVQAHRKTHDMVPGLELTNGQATPPLRRIVSSVSARNSHLLYQPGNHCHFAISQNAGGNVGFR